MTSPKRPDDDREIEQRLQASWSRAVSRAEQDLAGRDLVSAAQIAGSGPARRRGTGLVLGLAVLAVAVVALVAGLNGLRLPNTTAASPLPVSTQPTSAGSPAPSASVNPDEVGIPVLDSRPGLPALGRWRIRGPGRARRGRPNRRGDGRLADLSSAAGWSTATGTGPTARREEWRRAGSRWHARTGLHRDAPEGCGRRRSRASHLLDGRRASVPGPGSARPGAGATGAGPGSCPRRRVRGSGLRPDAGARPRADVRGSARCAGVLAAAMPPGGITAEQAIEIARQHVVHYPPAQPGQLPLLRVAVGSASGLDKRAATGPIAGSGTCT